MLIMLYVYMSLYDSILFPSMNMHDAYTLAMLAFLCDSTIIYIQGPHYFVKASFGSFLYSGTQLVLRILYKILPFLPFSLWRECFCVCESATWTGSQAIIQRDNNNEAVYFVTLHALKGLSHKSPHRSTWCVQCSCKHLLLSEFEVCMSWSYPPIIVIGV